MEVKNNQYQFKGGIKSVSLALIFVGIAAFAMSFGMNAYVGWVDLLVSSLFVTTMAVAGIFVLSVSGVIQASWSTPYKRIFEAMTTFLPVSFFLMAAPVIWGAHSLYEWTHEEVVKNDPILAAKTAWLNSGRFITTFVIIFAIWIVLSIIIRRFSDKMDSDSGVESARKFVAFSAVSIILFAFSLCTAAFDWIMSLEPHWFSTIFGIYVFAGAFVSCLAFTTLAIIYLKENGYLAGAVNENHLHDLGKWMFGMSIFWAYIWISQYLLIWYANIPEETEYYVLRHHHWNGIFWTNLVLNFVAPFFILMSRGAKRSTKVLKLACTVLLLGHFMDLYLMVAPKVFEHHNITGVSGLGIVQVLQLLGMLGLFVFVVFRSLSKRNLVPVNDPTFVEGSHLHQ